MKLLAMTSICVFLSALVYAQTDTLPKLTNSFEDYYKRNNIHLHYQYNEQTQTHNYSNNWDFDNDGKKDSLFFIGSGGAHLYFHLRIVLSSDHIPRDFPFIEIDFPALGNAAELKNVNNLLPAFPQFVIDDFDKDGVTNIYLYCGPDFPRVPRKWRKGAITSNHILVKYEHKEIVIENFKRN